MTKRLTLADFPEVAAQWHPVKNDDITPSDVASKSNKKYWWKCLKGHEWQTRCDNRTCSKSGCSYCSNKKIYASGVD